MRGWTAEWPGTAGGAYGHSVRAEGPYAVLHDEPERKRPMTARRVARYRLTFTGEQTVAVPEGSTLVEVQRSEAERDAMDLWVEATSAMDAVEYTVWLVKTGDPIPSDSRWMGSVQLGGGALILHVYVTGPTMRRG